jgi:hypothetical protein
MEAMMADPSKDQTAAAKEQLAKDAEARKKQNEEVAKRVETSKPTPTQEENDMARLGADVVEKQDDGSGPEVKLTLQREVTPAVDKPASGSYATRQVKPPAA